MLKEVFEDIRINKNDWLKSNTGVDFEDRFESSLKKYGFNRKSKEDKNIKSILNSIKHDIQNKTGENYIDNVYIKEDKSMGDCFVRIPYGSQNFPDFLIFTKKKIVPVEIKYSANSSTSPMWNSNLPKANAIYIFGSYGKRDVTYFLGEDVLPMKERKALLNFFTKIKTLESKFRKIMKEKMEEDGIFFDRGFNVYIRRAYEQNKAINSLAKTDYFSHKDRSVIEKNVICLSNDI